ncbi:hypothetical protein [Flavobacterium sp.]|jgi:hypothetical protein|uniref:hypothetical protein n=1 Tax=Flavobacterium sp. TaxID=239 RepID=UPI002A7F3153|nr:hypothetical protein [Flavobacterium sp.]
MKTALSYLFLIVNFSLAAQTNYTCNKLDSLSFEKAEQFLGKDNFQNYYYTSNNQLFKQNKNKTYNYKNIALGKIHDIAIENPLQIVLLYKNFNTVVLLDNQLNEVQKIDFNTIDPFLTITSIGFGGQNKLWFFDSNTQKIGLYDLITSSVKFLSTPFKGIISKKMATYNFLYFINYYNEYLSISIFGKIENLGSIPANDDFCFLDESKIIFTNNDSFFIYDFAFKTTSKLNVREKSIQNFFFKDDILSIFTDNKIINYQMNF